ncbi:PhoH family protein [Mycetocola sp.]|uniref:PhoH family protein n=1 Tax=Mycetocola sp. TaxID=1871042 RepID=UPI00398986C2
MANTVVLDTSVLLSAGRTALYSFGAHNVVLPLVVVRELETKRNDPDLGLAARSVLRALDALLSEGDLREGVSLGEDYGTIRIETNHVHDVPDSLKSYPSNDTKIVTVALNLSNEIDQDVFLVTKDVPLKVTASIVGVKTLDFTPQNISGDYIDSTETHWVTAEQIDEIHETGTVRLDLDIPRNVGVILRNEENPKDTALAISGKQYEFNLINQYEISGLESRSAEQAFAINYLMDEKVKIVSLGGRAGTGKTTLALAAGVEQLNINNGTYKKIIVFRSMHAVGGEELGFLPGTEAEKMDPWTAAIFDSLNSFLTPQQINILKTKQAIEVLPLTHIRGRTFNNAFIILDESQNLERSTILTALSRLGKNSKAVMSWDVSQRDNFRVGRHDGVYEVTSRLLGERLFAHTSLQKSERSDVAELVSRVLDDFDMK